ncbi:MAG: xanthine dehydrogenase family protein molybdopterin-binding subunit [Thermoplasmata archaeon]|nr:xanthine dehydrogenase family protein molybdopterin-binding subunit [Thermoplasmata archaeon]
MTRSDGPAKLEGRAEFGTDVEVPGMLWGALVYAPVAHGRIRRVPLSGVRSMPGVAAAVGPDDLDRLLPGGGDRNRPVFPRTEVMYRNQPIAAVAARTASEARAAADAVRADIEELPALIDLETRFPEWPGPEAARSEGIIAHVHARHGDPDGAFRSADLVLTETYRTSGIHQVAIEPHACVARVDGGVWHVTTTTQTPFGVREDAAEILGIREADLVVEGTWVGGGFGGKGAAFLEPYALLLAAAAGRPVRLGFGYREEFLLGRSTLPSIIRIETAVSGRRIEARRVRLLLDSGASLPGRDFATGYSIGFLLGPYKIPAFEMEGYAVRTNKPPFGPHRAPFAPQCVFALESHMDELARRLAVDPIAFRLEHVWAEGDPTQFGQRVGPFGARAALEAARARIAAWRTDAPAGHGIGVALGFWSTGTGAGGETRLRLSERELVIEQGEREIGSGSVIRGLVAVAERVTGLPAESIRVAYSDTSTAPYDTGVFGSRTVGALGQAVEKAAKTLLGILGERLGTPPVRLEFAEGRIAVLTNKGLRGLETLLTDTERTAGGLLVGGRHFGTPGTIDESRVLDGTFYPYSDFTAAVHACEVNVDPETGAVRVVRSAAFHDVGVVVDRPMAVAQIEGGVAMGLGEALTEEALWSSDGRLLNPGLLDYRIPTLGEVPSIEVVPIEGFLGAGPFGAKGLGEPPVIAVPAAVANAVAAATGARVFELPLTAERVVRALKRLEGPARA